MKLKELARDLITSTDAHIANLEQQKAQYIEAVQKIAAQIEQTKAEQAKWKLALEE